MQKATLLQRTNIIDFIQKYTKLSLIASTEGGEWAGPCPFCGGNDRFHVQPNRKGGGRWMCRHCAPGWHHNIIDFTMRISNCDFKTAFHQLANGARNVNMGVTKSQIRNSQPDDNISRTNWQKTLKEAALHCVDALWQPKNTASLDYLYSRGFQDRTIKRFQLGFSSGKRIDDLWIPQGITIPNFTAEKVCYLKIRLIPGVPCRCTHCKSDMQGPGVCPRCGKVTKYLGVRGNQSSSLFNADDLQTTDVALICEGEFNAMIVWQELNDVIAVSSVGSATNRLNLLNWGPYLLYSKLILVCFDNDNSGCKGAEYFTALSDKCRTISTPAEYNDINDFFCNGGNLWHWIRGLLDLYDPLCIK